MEKRPALLLQLELLWWVLTAVVAYTVLYPIHKAMHVWPFQGWNIIFVVALLTLSRYIFLLPHTFVAHRQTLKVVLLLLMFPLTFALIGGVNSFLAYIEDFTWDPLTGHLPLAEKASIEAYIWGEMLFFGVGSVISAPVFAGRLMLSIWRLRNRGTV
jgi:hypothetical protein